MREAKRCSSVRPRAGTLWTLDDLDARGREKLDHRCRSWLADRRLRDVAAILLDQSGDELNLLELYFHVPLPPDAVEVLDCLAQAASAAWMRREKGRIARLLGAHPAIADRLKPEGGTAPASLLSSVNPCRLTGSGSV